MKEQANRKYKTISSASLLVVLILLPAQLAFAKSGGHHVVEPPESFIDLILLYKVYWINFLIYVAILYWLLQRSLPKIWESRRSRFETQIKEAQSKMAESEQKLAETKALLSTMPEQVGELKQKLAVEVRMESERIISEASDKAAKIKFMASQGVAAERRSVTQEFKNKLIELSLSKAREKAAGQVSDEVESRFRGRVVSSISSLIQ